MSRPIDACVLCGSETEPRVMAIVEWIVPIGTEQWSHVPRCVDRAGCRDRVERVLGEAWPVNDRTPASTGLAESRAIAVLDSGPPSADPTASADAEEIPWLR